MKDLCKALHKSFKLPLASRVIRTRMDQCDVESGTHQGQLLRTIIGAVVHIQSLWQAASQQRLFHDHQEILSFFRTGKGGIGDDAAGIVDESDQIAAMMALSDFDFGPVCCNPN